MYRYVSSFIGLQGYMELKLNWLLLIVIFLINNGHAYLICYISLICLWLLYHPFSRKKFFLTLTWISANVLSLWLRQKLEINYLLILHLRNDWHKCICLNLFPPIHFRRLHAPICLSLCMTTYVILLIGYIVSACSMSYYYFRSDWSIPLSCRCWQYRHQLQPEMWRLV